MGEVNVDHMLRKISYTQFLEWQQFFEIREASPYADVRMDDRFAAWRRDFYNANRSRRQAVKKDLKSFVITYERRDTSSKAVEDRNKRLAYAFAATYGGVKQ